MKPIERRPLCYVLTAHDPWGPVCVANSVDWLQIVGKQDEAQQDRDTLQRLLLEIAECEGEV